MIGVHVTTIAKSIQLEYDFSSVPLIIELLQSLQGFCLLAN